MYILVHQETGKCTASVFLDSILNGQYYLYDFLEHILWKFKNILQVSVLWIYEPHNLQTYCTSTLIKYYKLFVSMSQAISVRHI